MFSPVTAICLLFSSLRYVKATSNNLGLQRRSSEVRTCSICSRLGTNLVESNLVSALLPNNTCGDSNRDIVALNISESDITCAMFQTVLENKCCDQTSFPETYECASNVRSKIVGDDSYDTYVAPLQAKKDNPTMRVMEIDTLINFLAVKTLDVKTSTLELYLDIFLRWNDPRLKWDINETNCVGSVHVRASPSAEETEIWVPSLDVYNRGTSLNELTGPPALVSHDGTGTYYFQKIFCVVVLLALLFIICSSQQEHI